MTDETKQLRSSLDVFLRNAEGLAALAGKFDVDAVRAVLTSLRSTGLSRPVATPADLGTIRSDLGAAHSTRR